MPKIIIYSTPVCVYCNIAKEFFKENNIKYEEKDVAVDQDALKEAIQKSGQMGVPVIDIDGKILVGFDKTELSKLLDIK